MTTISTVLGSNCSLGTSSDMATFLAGKTGKFAVISWDDIKSALGNSMPDAASFEDILAAILYKGADFCTNNTKTTGDGRQFNIAVGNKGVSSSWETGVSKTSYSLNCTLYGTDSNPSRPSATDL